MSISGSACVTPAIGLNPNRRRLSPTLGHPSEPQRRGPSALHLRPIGQGVCGSSKPSSVASQPPYHGDVHGYRDRASPGDDGNPSDVAREALRGLNPSAYWWQSCRRPRWRGVNRATKLSTRWLLRSASSSIGASTSARSLEPFSWATPEHLSKIRVRGRRILCESQAGDLTPMVSTDRTLRIMRLTHG